MRRGRVWQKLQSRAGVALYLQFLIVLVLFMTVISAAIQVGGVLAIKKGIEDTATEMARYIELEGAVNQAVSAEFARLKSVTGVDCEMDIDGAFASGKKLQLESTFTVTITGEGRIFELPVPLIAKATGRSEVYHKR